MTLKSCRHSSILFFNLSVSHVMYILCGLLHISAVELHGVVVFCSHIVEGCQSEF